MRTRRGPNFPRSLVLGVLLLAACRAAKDDQPSVRGRLDEALHRYGEASCEAIFRCGRGSPLITQVRLLMRDEANCRRSMEQFMQDRPDGYIRGLYRLEQEGSLVIDESALERCLERTAECLFYTHNCLLRAFSGAAELGAPCTHSAQCRPDAYCSHMMVDGSCVSACTARRSSGQPCDEGCDTEVPGDWGCLQENAITENCRVDGEARRVGRGAPCGWLPQEGFAACEEGLECNLSRGGVMNTCEPPLSLGDSCDRVDESSDVCEDGAFCARSGETLSCQPLELRGPGQACNDLTTDTAKCDLYGGVTCDDDIDTCIALGDGTLGTRCLATDSSFFLLPSCRRGLFCHRDTERCQPLLGDGSACEYAMECDSGWCDASGRCSAQRCSGP